MHATNFQRIATICFSVYHLHDIFVDRLSGLVAIPPIVCSSDSILADKEVFRIVDILIWSRLDAVDDLEPPLAVRRDMVRLITYTRLQIYQDRARDIACVIRLVEEDVFAIATLCRELL
jgi:hypothetical protein